MYGECNMEDNFAVLSTILLILYYMSSIEKENFVILNVLLFLLRVLMQSSRSLYSITCDSSSQHGLLTSTISFTNCTITDTNNKCAINIHHDNNFN